MDKIRVGIFFGGPSREREISFAGGRTVYDNLDKSLYEPVPIFVDSLGSFIELDWKYIYKGSIRDFYPPVNAIPASENNFQIYLESIPNLEDVQYREMIKSVGRLLAIEELKNSIDIAFLALHGAKGEDGSIQGLLDFLDIPYTGSGILPSAIGINKSVQKEWMPLLGFESKPSISIPRDANDYHRFYSETKEKIGFPCVIRPAHQGSSIGVSILREDDYDSFSLLIDKAFFRETIKLGDWNTLEAAAKVAEIRRITDIRESVGLPLLINGETIYHPEELLQLLNSSNEAELILEGLDSETEVLIEGFIDGKEFSCIVIRDEAGKSVALPPTEIMKGQEVYDYRSKYMPGLSRKKTPIDLALDTIQSIQAKCVSLFEAFRFHTYARIDGFYDHEGKVYLNDPNTTSGMLPSSFFFHQAAEVGWNPSQFLNFIIRNSVAERLRASTIPHKYSKLLQRIDQGLDDQKNAAAVKQKVGIVLGGYSFERHISVESGRNVYEKLASSSKYEAIPIFLAANGNDFDLYQIPIHLLLKDNADDIRDNILNFKKHSITENLKEQSATLIEKYRSDYTVLEPQKLDKNTLNKYVDLVFIALHGRPGEDGTLQKLLVQQKIPFNGSMPHSANITINKFDTLQKLKEHGFKVTKQHVYHKDDYVADPHKMMAELNHSFMYPFILKPLDDGCSSAVKLIKNDIQLAAYLDTMFRTELDIDPQKAKILDLKPKEEFPRKREVLAEALIQANGAQKFLEITGGMITHHKGGNIEYEMFHPSEALAGSEILSLEEKFLAGEGQNITPARFAIGNIDYNKVADQVRSDLKRAAKILEVDGYCRIDAFVRIFDENNIETIIIEINSLPGMTPATAIFHQSALNNYKPFNFIDQILTYGVERNSITKT